MKKLKENLTAPFSIRLPKETAVKVLKNSLKSYMTPAAYIRLCIAKLEEEFGLPTFGERIGKGGK